MDEALVSITYAVSGPAEVTTVTVPTSDVVVDAAGIGFTQEFDFPEGHTLRTVWIPYNRVWEVERNESID